MNERQRAEMQPLLDDRHTMVEQQRQERRALSEHQSARQIKEAKARSDRLNKGLRGVWDKLTGKSKAIRTCNEAEAWASAKRDQTQRDGLILQHMRARQALQKKIKALRTKHKEDQKLLIRDLVRYVRGQKENNAQARSQDLKRNRSLRRDL